jgi:hypothetical protein
MDNDARAPFKGKSLTGICTSKRVSVFGLGMVRLLIFVPTRERKKENGLMYCKVSWGRCRCGKTGQKLYYKGNERRRSNNMYVFLFLKGNLFSCGNSTGWRNIKYTSIKRHSLRNPPAKSRHFSNSIIGSTLTIHEEIDGQGVNLENNDTARSPDRKRGELCDYSESNKRIAPAITLKFRSSIRS